MFNLLNACNSFLSTSPRSFFSNEVVNSSPEEATALSNKIQTAVENQFNCGLITKFVRAPLSRAWGSFVGNYYLEGQGRKWGAYLETKREISPSIRGELQPLLPTQTIVGTALSILRRRDNNSSYEQFKLESTVLESYTNYMASHLAINYANAKLTEAVQDDILEEELITERELPTFERASRTASESISILAVGVIGLLAASAFLLRR